MPLKVSALRLKASGTGNDLLDVAAVKAWWDRDANGVVDPTDTLLASDVYPADDGVAHAEPRFELSGAAARAVRRAHHL